MIRAERQTLLTEHPRDGALGTESEIAQRRSQESCSTERWAGSDLRSGCWAIIAEYDRPDGTTRDGRGGYEGAGE